MARARRSSKMAALAMLEQRLEGREVETRARLQRRQRLDDSLVEHSYGELGSILGHDQHWAGSATGGDDLFAAFQLVGRPWE